MTSPDRPILSAINLVRSYEHVHKGLDILQSGIHASLVPDVEILFEAMKAQGWVNPDNVGVTWYHPLVVTPDAPGGALMSEQLALPIAELWETYPERKPDARTTFSTDNDPLD